LNKLHLSNQKEIEMGKVAEKGGQSKDVRNFGKELVKDHTAADKKVAALAKEEHIDLAAAGATTDHMPQPGPDFDLKFAQMMVEDHTNDINEAQTAHDTTSDSKLKELLGKLLPTLKKHKETAQRIVQSQTAHAQQ
jgi:putative membrane protein